MAKPEGQSDRYTSRSEFAPFVKKGRRRLKHLRWLPDLAKDRDFTSKLIKEDHFVCKPQGCLSGQLHQVHPMKTGPHILAVFRLFTCQRAQSFVRRSSLKVRRILTANVAGNFRYRRRVTSTQPISGRSREAESYAS